ncbi:MAG: hypothetical protein KC619_20165 [Myxococcales bacterium]|nr:hypothetical protein [Myxococcales bacterium]
MTEAVRRIVLAFLALSACTDPSECRVLDQQQCDSQGTSVLRCARTDHGLRWQTEPCDPGVPTCVERGGNAFCVAERLGDCDVETFEDSCPDAHTLEDCTSGIRHRIRCLEGQSCGEVPAHAVGEGRPPHASHACFAARDPRDPPALVTYVRGEVQLDGAPAPAVPFRVPAHGVLRLADGARAVVLVQERPSRLEGPGDFDVYERAPEDAVPASWATAIVDVLEHDPPRGVPPEEPLSAPAPSETGVIRLTIGEGTPGASSTLGELTWRCDGAGPCGRTIELRATGTNARVLWRGSGDPGVRYDGPDLEVGETYELRVGDHTYRVETLPPPPVLPLLRAMADWPLQEQMSVVAAVHLWNGSRASAAATLRRTLIELHGRDPETEALLGAYGLARR